MLVRHISSVTRNAPGIRMIHQLLVSSAFSESDSMAANRNFYNTNYIRLPDLLVEIAMARGDGTYREYMKKLKKTKLLILDEWLLYPLKESEARDVLELVEARAKTASTIFCSQFDVPGWHENLYDPTLADAICDRIVYDSYIIRIEGDTMRKRKGIMD